MNHRVRAAARTALALVAPLAVAGCAGAAGPAPVPESRTAPPPSATIRTLCEAGTDCPADFLIWADAARAAALEASVETFGREHGVVARVQAVDGILGRLTWAAGDAARSGASLRTSTPARPAVTGVASLRTSTPTGTADAVPRTPDVFVGAHEWLGRLVSQSLVTPVPLPSDVAGRFAETAIRATRFGGVAYGVPHAVENVALIRNTSLAPDAPATMDELVAKGRELLAAKKASRILAQFVSAGGNAYYALPYLAAFPGGGVFGVKANGDYDPTKVIVNSPGSVRGGEVLRRLGAAGVLAADVDDTTMDQMFTAGTTPYLISGPWSAAKAKAANVPYAISPLPRLTGGGPMRPFVGVQMFYASATGKSPQLAREFLANWVPRKDVQLALYSAGRRPPALREAFEEAARSEPELRSWFEAGAAGMLIPGIPAMDAVWKPAGLATVQIITGKAAPKARLDALQREILLGIARG